MRYQWVDSKNNIGIFNKNQFIKRGLQQYSIWEEESFLGSWDITIVGAGFTGLWSAICLKQKFPAKKILVMDKDASPRAASSRNAGFACFGSFTEIAADIAAMGLEKTRQLVAMRFEGLRTIQKIFAPGLIDYLPCKGYELLDDPPDKEKLHQINESLYEITGSQETFLQKDELIPGFGFKQVSALIENRMEGNLHPGKLLTALFQLAVNMGIQFLPATELKEVEEKPNGLKLKCKGGLVLGSDRILYCTNALSKHLLPQLDLMPTRGQVLLTAPIQGLKLEGTFHYQEGFYYFRNLGNRILLGGARNTSFATEFTQDAFTSLPIQQALEAFLCTRIVPGLEPKITHRWAGIMAMGKEKTPIIQQLTPRSFCAVRMGGMGVALAPSVGKQVAAIM